MNVSKMLKHANTLFLVTVQVFLLSSIQAHAAPVFKGNLDSFNGYLVSSNCSDKLEISTSYSNSNWPNYFYSAETKQFPKNAFRYQNSSALGVSYIYEFPIKLTDVNTVLSVGGVPAAEVIRFGEEVRGWAKTNEVTCKISVKRPLSGISKHEASVECANEATAYDAAYGKIQKLNRISNFMVYQDCQ